MTIVFSVDIPPPHSLARTLAIPSKKVRARGGGRGTPPLHAFANAKDQRLCRSPSNWEARIQSALRFGGALLPNFASLSHGRRWNVPLGPRVFYWPGAINFGLVYHRSNPSDSCMSDEGSAFVSASMAEGGRRRDVEGEWGTWKFLEDIEVPQFADSGVEGAVSNAEEDDPWFHVPHAHQIRPLQQNDETRGRSSCKRFGWK